MTLEDVLQELIERSVPGATPQSLGTVRQWPDGAIGVFRKRMDQATVAASSVECPACEESVSCPCMCLQRATGAHRGLCGL